MYGRNEIKKIRQQYSEYMDSSTPVSSDVSSAYKSSSARQQMKTAGLMRRSVMKQTTICQKAQEIDLIHSVKIA